MTETKRPKVTLGYLYEKMRKGEPLTMITCYDYPMADLVEKAAVDIVLVGDSMGMTILGFDSTLPVTQDVMMPHVQAVRRGTPNAWLIGDMPYMTYQPSVETAIRCAGRFMAEGACDAVKLEGGVEMADRVAGIVRSGIPCMGHLGLTPQSVSALGGYKVQGKGAHAGEKNHRRCQSVGRRRRILDSVRDGSRPRVRVDHQAREHSDHLARFGTARARTIAHLPRHVQLVPEIQAEDGKSIWRRRQNNRRWVEAVRRRSDRQAIPATGELVRHQG